MAASPVGKEWIPYIGLRGKARCCYDLVVRWRVHWSPIATNKWENSFQQNCFGITNPDNIERHATNMRMDGENGQFVAGEFETLAGITENLLAQFWLRGSWVDIRGDTQLNQEVIQSTLYELQESSRKLSDSQYTQSWIAAGIGAEYTF